MAPSDDGNQSAFFTSAFSPSNKRFATNAEVISMEPRVVVMQEQMAVAICYWGIHDDAKTVRQHAPTQEVREPHPRCMTQFLLLAPAAMDG